MKILVDEHVLEESKETLAEALSAGVIHAESAGRVVVGVSLDGQTLDNQTLAEGSPDLTGDELVLLTEDPRELAAKSAEQAIEALEVAREIQAKVADAFDEGNSEKAMALLGEALEAWGAARRVVEYTCEMLGIDPGSLQTSGATGAEAIERLTDALTELKRAIPEQDTAVISDLARYDLAELAELWSEILQVIRDRVRAD